MKRLLVLAFLIFPSAAFGQISVAAGSTSQCFPVSVLNSSVTTGAGLTGLAYNSASLTCSYYRQNAGTGGTAITMASSTLGTYTSGAFKEIDSTKQPGDYEFCPPNAALAAGANWVRFWCGGATNMAPVRLTVNLVSPNSFGYDGQLTSESGTTLGLASAGVDADDQFNNGFAIVVYDSAGLISAKSCIVDSANTGDTVTTKEDITALVAVNDNYVIQADAGCKLDSVQTELAACPTAASSPLDALKFLFQAMRHKVACSSTSCILYKDDGSTTLCTFSNTDSAGTFTSGEAS